ncbi:HD domain-containing protein [Actinoallomurus spadix]|uniref:HD domain-containing protein n=1 Tax=Actinoallomurus spadix TaxID=79912 RepID=UPI0020930202|nr:HD domain-containing protein [Actinoallomurus spadix]MCO5984937.1 HD domain-containing protein [Actinoallomurus spadix]
MAPTPLHRALTELGPDLRPLPPRAEGLLRELDAPPRLAAHLRAVHDVAHQLLDRLDRDHGDLAADREAVLFGAASHDIGKTIHRQELSGPGSAHEEAGHRILLDHGVEERLARFARTHASWTEPGITIEDLLVSLADKIWKAKRLPDLEQRAVAYLTEASGKAPWQVFRDLDDLLTDIAADADHRLAFQSSYPIS